MNLFHLHSAFCTPTHNLFVFAHCAGRRNLAIHVWLCRRVCLRGRRPRNSRQNPAARVSGENAEEAQTWHSRSARERRALTTEALEAPRGTPTFSMSQIMCTAWRGRTPPPGIIAGTQSENALQEPGDNCTDTHEESSVFHEQVGALQSALFPPSASSVRSDCEQSPTTAGCGYGVGSTSKRKKSRKNQRDEPPGSARVSSRKWAIQVQHEKSGFNWVQFHQKQRDKNCQPLV